MLKLLFKMLKVKDLNKQQIPPFKIMKHQKKLLFLEELTFPLVTRLMNIFLKIVCKKLILITSFSLFTSFWYSICQPILLFLYHWYLIKFIEIIKKYFFINNRLNRALFVVFRRVYSGFIESTCKEMLVKLCYWVI